MTTDETLDQIERMAVSPGVSILHLPLRLDMFEPGGVYYEMRRALKEIAKGKGRYDHDPFEHCQNTVEDMKALARQALDGKYEGSYGQG